jgi:hypothetical protein
MNKKMGKTGSKNRNVRGDEADPFYKNCVVGIICIVNESD